MLNRGALSLLTDYGGDSSDDELPGAGVSVKRLHDCDEEDHQSKRVQRLPVPNIFLDNKVTMEHTEDPLLHGGRLRSFAHERGNWATYVYIPYVMNEGIQELINLITTKNNVIQKLNMKEVEDFHISLTKTLILRHHWISSFVNSIKKNITHFKKFIILFDELKVYCNEERTRTFIGLQIKTGYDSLLNLVEVLDKCLEEFDLPVFYKDPSFHMSIAWCVGDFEEELKSALPQLNHQLAGMMEEYSQENWYIYVDYLLCKCGNKNFQFHLR